MLLRYNYNDTAIFSFQDTLRLKLMPYHGSAYHPLCGPASLSLDQTLDNINHFAELPL